MRSLTTTFQLSMYGMLLLSCLMLAFAEGSVIPQGMSIPLVVLAWIFVERYHALRLPLWGANALGLAAFGLALLELMSSSLEARLLAGAHLLVYLSWVVLFQKKTVRHYWWLAALSVLQVAVGAVLTASGAYGLLLLIYFFGMIWTLLLFSMWQMQEKFREDQEREKGAEGAGAAPAVSGDAGAPGDAAALNGAGLASDAGLAAAAGSFAVLRQPSQTRGTLQVDPDEHWLRTRFGVGSALTSAASLVVASLFFALIPRFWIGTPSFGNNPVQPGVRSLTGFTEKVRLGDIGRIMESTEPVLQVKLFDNTTEREINIEDYAHRMGWDEPLFRGAVLSLYDRGDWTSGLPEGGGSSLMPNPGDEIPYVRQEITMQPIGTSIVLAMHPVRAGRITNSNLDLNESRARNMLVLRDRTRPRSALSYVAFSPVPEKDLVGLRPMPSQAASLKQLCLRLPGNLDGLRREADRVAGIQENQPRPRKEEMVDRLVHWLRDSGEFSYSLDSSVQNYDIDPVEDFLLLRKQGHCEYYASALALMLRSVGIPSRMVSGFKGGKINRISGAYEVEQRHAHAWVEALLNDRWVTLDATPSNARSESVEALEPEMRTFHDLLTYAREIWSIYVVNLSFGHQRDRFYAPFQEAFNATSESLSGEDGGKPGLLKRLAKFFASPEEWISWKGGVVSFTLLCLGATFVWAGRRILAAVRRMEWAGSRRGAAVRRRVEFYERFQKLAAAAGLSRGDGETQREFGRTVDSRWEPLLATAELGGVSASLTELFYRVRFGENELDAAEAAEIDRSLTRLEKIVAGG